MVIPGQDQIKITPGGNRGFVNELWLIKPYPEYSCRQSPDVTTKKKVFLNSFPSGNNLEVSEIAPSASHSRGARYRVSSITGSCWFGGHTSQRLAVSGNEDERARVR